MQRIRLNLTDWFSGCTHSIEKNVDADQLSKIEQLQINAVPLNQFKNGINYTWIIEEVELLEQI